MQLYLASSLETTGNHIANKIRLQGETLKVAFIYTAGEIEKDQAWIDDDRKGLTAAGVEIFNYTITGKKPAEIGRDLVGFNWIHVNGGNSFYFLFQAQQSGFDRFICRQVTNGVVYSGSSAGSYLAGPDIAVMQLLDHNPYAKQLKNTRGFGFVDFLTFPHWGSPIFRDDYFSQRLQLAYTKGHKIILLNDDQYVEVIDDNYKIIDITKD